jgi:hypothetical protein
MRRSSKKLPEDVNQRALEVVRLATEEQPPPNESIRDYLAGIGRKGGLKGGKARADALPASKRKAIAQNAAKARWSKKQV